MTATNVSAAGKCANGVVRTHRPKGEAKREAILDAAERIFAERGYHGTSLRDVAQDARAGIGLLNYYFPTKAELFRQVVLRRRDVLQERVAASLRAVGPGGNPHEAGAGVIRAFLAAFLEICVGADEGLRNYVRLTSRFMTAYNEPELHDPLTSLHPITELFVDKLRSVYPHMNERRFHAALYAMEASLIFMVQDPGFLDELSGGHHRAAAIDRIVDDLVPFFAGGLHAIAGH
ncbi:TetR/AcrR family transcriptional regulator [Pedomonas sp. V897]|uniref:TetR/AcrR family transcriptional regulator n=1 Tax=Pedomonas sp. V897 TaxID=3446482 RepID=UPI003EE206CA